LPTAGARLVLAYLGWHRGDARETPGRSAST